MTKDDNMKIKPDRKDFDAIEQQYGRLPHTATVQEEAKRYRLAQAAKLIRLYAPSHLNRR
jgi:hypothetical protein